MSEAKEVNISMNAAAYRQTPKIFSNVQVFGVSEREVMITFGTLNSLEPAIDPSFVAYMTPEGFEDFVKAANDHIEKCRKKHGSKS